MALAVSLLPGAEQPGQPDHLAGVDVDRDLVQLVVARQAGRLQDRDLARLGRSLAEARSRVLDFGEGAPEHLGHQLDPADPRQWPVVHEATVSKHGHLVTGSKDLVKAMRDVHDGDPVGAKPRHGREQSFDLPRFERRRRLVHDDEAVVGRHRPCDRDHLLHAQAQLA